jgi:hypothetical protein
MRRIFLIALVGTFLLPASAEAMVQIDRGIAGVAIANTRSQVRAALGTPTTVTNGTNEFGVYTQYRYAGGVTVTFQGGRRVSGVSTSGLGDRTASGVGVRSTEAAVRSRVPGVTCETIAGTRSCHTGAFEAGKRVTAFSIVNGRVTRVTVALVID